MRMRQRRRRGRQLLELSCVVDVGGAQAHEQLVNDALPDRGRQRAKGYGVPYDARIDINVPRDRGAGRKADVVVDVVDVGIGAGVMVIGELIVDVLVTKL